MRLIGLGLIVIGIWDTLAYTSNPIASQWSGFITTLGGWQLAVVFYMIAAFLLILGGKP